MATAQESEAVAEAEPESEAASTVEGAGDGGGDSSTEVATVPQSPAETAAQAALDKLAGELGADLLDSFIKPTGDLWVRVSTQSWQAAGIAARDVLDCVWFDFLSVIDWLPSPFGRDMDTEQDRLAQGAPARELAASEPGYTGGDTRLQVFARVATTYNSAEPDAPHRLSLILKADVPDANPTIDTWIPAYAGADWHEREAWEMFGVVFNGHPDLRHIYLPGEFEGHPMRKDFPLLARRVKPWPGIVDVEAMPGEAAEGDADPAAEN